MIKWKTMRLAALLLLLLGALSAPGIAQQEAAPEGEAETEQPVKQIRLYAENWKWIPNKIHVKQGTLLKIEVRNSDAPHRFDLKEYDLKVPLPEDETIHFEFVADKVGTFRWKCGRPCGNGCPKMRGELIVEE
jgi:heme/copper-type cytochrome/quinol oxidase subunit 2